MSDSETHFWIGAAAGVLACSSYKNIQGQTTTVQEILYSGLLGGLAALVPDVIEPACNPNHRGTFHSMFLSSLMAIVNKQVITNNDVSDEQKRLTVTASAGYLSHLLVDATTRKGLPIA